jgi:class 3 adenylate cyclase
MAFGEQYFRWQWDLQSGPEALWPFVSDTNRFNYDGGNPSLKEEADSDSLPSGYRHLYGALPMGTLEWDEEPYEWVRPERFGVMRHFRRGFMERLLVEMELAPRAGGGTTLTSHIRVKPRDLSGLLIIPYFISWRTRRHFDKSFREYDHIASLPTPSVLDFPGNVNFTRGGRRRLRATREALLHQGAWPHLIERLAYIIENSDDMTVSRLRPYMLADVWGISRRHVLSAFLWATREGMLSFEWNILCPLCRGSKQTAATLGEVATQVHCNSCNIDFTVNFDRSVELTFHPNPAIRPHFTDQFCVGGPQVTPHIIAQQQVGPHDVRELALPLEEGRYRVRTLALRGGQFLRAGPKGEAQGTFYASADTWPNVEPQLSTKPTVLFQNLTEVSQVFILERMAWSDQAATAAEVTTLQTFRDLFANEALRPGEKISVGSLTVVFTDLRGSTQMYREDGDALAFGRVMEHFDILRRAVDDEEGAVVKTMGDAVMAVFRRPVSALRAFINAQKLLMAPPKGVRPLYLKVGIHSGPCVAVTINNRLDYFGSTVNMASRLEALDASFDGAIISSAVRNDPEVVEWLETGEVEARAFEATLKGFESERFTLWAVIPAGQKQSQPDLSPEVVSA